MKKEFWGLAFFPALLLLVGSVALMQSSYNAVLFDQLNQPLSAIESVFWQCLTVLGDGWIAVVFAFVLILLNPALFKSCLLGIVFAVLLTHGLKDAFYIPRPAAVLSGDDIVVVGKLLTAHNSYPSGHTLTAFFWAGLVAFQYRLPWLTGVMFLIAMLSGISRIMVGAHWPADILLGGALGWMIAWGVYWASQSKWGNTLKPRFLLWVHVVFLVLTLLMLTHNTHYPAGNVLMVIVSITASLWMAYRGYQLWKYPPEVS